MKAILALNKFNVIGDGRDLIWNVPEDMEFFKYTTQGCAVLMGRKTFTSLNRLDGLPRRLNYVMTRSEVPHGKNVQIVSGWAECDDEMMVIGGATLYDYCFTHKLVDTIYVSQIKNNHGNDINTGTALKHDLYGVIPSNGGSCVFAGSNWIYHSESEGFQQSANPEFSYRIGVLRRQNENF